MEHGRRRLVPGHPARAREPVVQVEVLHVHPVALVEEADVLEGLAADQHEGTVDGIHQPGLSLVEIGRPVLPEARAGAPAAPDAGEVGERAERRRKRPLRGVVEAAVVALQPRPGHAELGARVEQRAQQLERPVGHPRVGVEHQHVRGRPGADGEVVRAAEPDIARVPRQGHLGKLALDHLGRAVVRGVVDNVHGDRPLGRMRPQRSPGTRAAAPRSGTGPRRRPARPMTSGPMLALTAATTAALGPANRRLALSSVARVANATLAPCVLAMLDSRSPNHDADCGGDR